MLSRTTTAHAAACAESYGRDCLGCSNCILFYNSSNLNNPYHNFRHTLLHVLWLCEKACRYYQKTLAPRQMRNLLIAALFHDFDHPGHPHPATLDLLESGRAAAVDVLLVDYAMPGMLGAEVIRAAKRTRPDLPAVLMTGYADPDGLGEDLRHAALLKKPFRLHEFEAALDSARSPRAREPVSSNVISLARSRR